MPVKLHPTLTVQVLWDDRLKSWIVYGSWGKIKITRRAETTVSMSRLTVGKSVQAVVDVLMEQLPL